MDILTHALSGAAAGTLFAGFSNKGFKAKGAIVTFAAIGGILPDSDAISLWSGFDGTIGKLFALAHSGRDIYSAKFWYSHHGFLHSIVAAALAALLIGTIVYLIRRHKSKYSLSDYKLSLKSDFLLMAAFFTGFIIHSLMDMPTPASTWGGVNLFWPLPVYAGGSGEIWWWNNYDIFLIVLLVLIINITILSLRKISGRRQWRLTIMVFIAGTLLTIVQTKTRSYDFNYTGNTPRYQEYEQRSKDLQKEMLGDGLYSAMSWLDRHVRVNF